MKKLAGIINFVIGTIIAAAFLYAFSFIIVFIAMCIIALVRKIWYKIFPLPEWSKWVQYDTAPPKIIREKGVMYFQSANLYERVNNYTGEIQIKKEIDPTKRKLSEATNLKDMFFLKNYIHA